MCIYTCVYISVGLPWWLSNKESAYQCRRCRFRKDLPGSERSPEEGNGSPLFFSFLENPMDRGARRATVQGS